MIHQIEKILYCPLSSLQVCLHDGIASQCLAARLKAIEKEKHTSPLDGGDKKTKKIVIQQSILNSRFINMNYNNLVMQLRKLCNHPYLVLEDAQTIPDSLYFRDLLCSSGKLVVLDKLLDQLLINEDQEQHKILIFSQMTTMLNILQGFLHTKGIACYRLDGSTDRHTREEIISNFYNNNKRSSQGESSVVGMDGDGGKGVASGIVNPLSSDGALIDENVNEDVRVFLLSTRAGKLSSLQTM